MVPIGSNHPASRAEDCLEDFEALDEATAGLFLYESAARVPRTDDA
jgi:hypothetical protein